MLPLFRQQNLQIQRMSSICYDEQMYKKLLPVPKTHLFMKKMARIQAIDRQVRKKWIKIKRQNQQKNLESIQNGRLSPFKQQVTLKQTQVSFEPVKDHSQLSQLQSYLKREKILNNHRRQEQIFYGRKNKILSQNNSLKSSWKGPKNDHAVSVQFDSPRKSLKTEPTLKMKQKSVQNNKHQNNQAKLDNKVSLQRLIKKPSRRYTEQEQKERNLQKQIKSMIKLPKMFQKRNNFKSKQMEILNSQSAKQLVYLSQKSDQSIKQWANHKRNLFQKLKGSQAYYILRSPTKFDDGLDDN